MKLINTRTILLAAAMALCVVVLPAHARSDQGHDLDVWFKIKQGFFPGIALTSGLDSIIALEAPKRATNGGQVPIVIRTKRISIAPEDAIKRVTLIVDKNPNPIGAEIEIFEPGTFFHLETRIRVEEYSFVRAVVETLSGEFHMATRYVKSSGGCSAPASESVATLAKRMGKGKSHFVTTDAYPDLIAPADMKRLEFTLSHPQHSGFVKDLASMQYIPAHYVREIRVEQNNSPIVRADVNFTLSENPSMRLWIKPLQASQAIDIHFVDTEERKFHIRATPETLQKGSVS